MQALYQVNCLLLQKKEKEKANQVSRLIIVTMLSTHGKNTITKERKKYHLLSKLGSLYICEDLELAYVNWRK